MARRDDFDEKAMEDKIANNLARGFTYKTILDSLLREKMQCFTTMRSLEARALELSDQIDYMKENYVKSDDIHG